MNRTIQLALHTILPASVGPEHPDRLQGKQRSPQWPAFRKKHIKKSCEVCGATKNLDLHHLDPFHLFPERELDPLNVVTLCNGPGICCHITFGHLGTWLSWNPTCLEDIEEWREKIERRPLRG